MKRWTRALAVLLAMLGMTGCALPDQHISADTEAPPALRLTVLNIGKADSLLLQWNGEAYLIDAGYDPSAPAVEAMLAHYGVDRLNAVFLTHCHRDHYGGLAALAQSKIKIDAWYASAMYTDVDAAQHPAALAAAIRGQTPVYLKAGDGVPAGGGAAFAVLGPTLLNEDNENNNSLVLRFSCAAGSVLLAGDMKEDEEYDLLQVGAFEKSDVLKVGHHGDGKATTLAMLRVVQPKVSVISTSSQEESDTPARGVLNRLAAVGSDVYVTQDAHDAIEITLQNGEIQVQDLRWENAPDKVTSLTLSLDVSDDRLTVRNAGSAAVSLSGCVLYSTRGDEMLALPDVTVQPGQAFAVGSQVTRGSVDCVWSVKRVWHKKKLDVAVLYDPWGRPVACTDNGMAE